MSADDRLTRGSGNFPHCSGKKGTRDGENHEEKQMSTETNFSAHQWCPLLIMQ